jgi:hypothetical protein
MVKKNNKDNLIKIPTLEGSSFLSNVFTIFIDNLNPKIAECFKLFDESLFDLAEKSDSNLKQTTYLDSLQIVREYKIQSINNFLLILKSIFKSFQKNNFKYSNLGTSSRQNNDLLELVKKSKLDESLAVSNLIKKSETAYHRHIFAFKIRFSELMHKQEFNVEEIPVSPFILVHSFKECIKNIDIDANLKIILYQSFERNVMGHLNDTYKKINDLFIEKGIVPEIKYNIYSESNKKKSIIDKLQNKPDKQTDIKFDQDLSQGLVQDATQNMPKGFTHNASLGQPQNLAQDASQEQSQNQHQNFKNNNHNNLLAQQNLDQNYQLITQFLALSREISNRNKNTHVSGNLESENNHTNNFSQKPNIDLNLVINALTVLQNNILNNNVAKTAQHSPHKVKDELFEQLHRIDSSTTNQKIKQIDEDTIDLVGMLFQFIINDKNIPKTIQLVLVKLQLPYLKIALQDRNLFGDKKHEARVLLDSMAISSVGWTKESDLNNQFINKIQEITNHIIEIEKYNSKIFDMLLINFEDFLTKLKKKSDISIKRSKERAKGDENIILAKEKTAQLLVDNMLNKSIPLIIRNILLQEWASILILVHLKYTPQSKEFKKAVNFIAKIIEYSQPQVSYLVDKKAIETLLTFYESGLKFIIFKRDELQNKKHELKACLYQIHTMINNQGNNDPTYEFLCSTKIFDFSPQEKQENELISYIENILIPKTKANLKITKDKYTEKVSTLKIGTWLNFSESDNTSIRAKLSWISPVSGVYVFVNSRGFNIFEKTSMELAKGFENESITILLQIALFDRALSSIAEELNNKPNLFNH